MAQPKVDLLYVEPQVCNWCYPDCEEELGKLTSHLLTKDGCWKGWYTAEKSAEHTKICNDYRQPKLALCLVIDFERDIYICKKYLLEQAERL